jgi:hypothetical protein
VVEPTVLESETTAEVVTATGPPWAPEPLAADPLAPAAPPAAPLAWVMLDMVH